MHEQLEMQQVPSHRHTPLLKNKACIPYLYEIYKICRGVGWGEVCCMSALWPAFISKTTNKELSGAII